MGDVFDSYYDTAGNYHYTDTETGHHVIRNNSNAELDRGDTVKDTFTTAQGTPTSPVQIFANYGWICPVCGRGLSPYTSVCPCQAGNGWEVTC